MVYQFSSGISRPKGLTAQQIGESLESVVEKRGSLTPENVVKEATDEQHILHPVFEWDNEKAAHKYRCQQARAVVQCVYVQIQPEAPVVRAFVSVTPEESSKQYLSIGVALENQDTKDQVLSNARRELNFFHKKYSDLVELDSLYLEKIKNIESVLH